MHSKIFNMIGSDSRTKINRTPEKYLNFLRTSDQLEPLSRIYDGVAWHDVVTEELPNYPLSNIVSDFSITKEAKITSVDIPGNDPWKTSGLTINSLAAGNFSNILIFFNKLDKEQFAKYKVSLVGYPIYGLKICFRHKTNQDLSKLISFDLNNGLTIADNMAAGGLQRIFEDSYYSGSLEDGILHLDETLLYKIFGTENVLSSTYYIDIYFNYPIEFNFSIANIFVGNSINFYVEEDVKFKLENLNKYTSNKRTGKTFTQVNSNVKNLTIKYTNLFNSQWLENDKNFYMLNKDYPLAILPYNNYNNNYVHDEKSFEWQKTNYRLGGLYYIGNDYEVENPTYDNFNYDIDFIEYK